MSLQTAIIKEFNYHYPNIPLREVTSLTGIQITRVFRLYNGSEMKLKEYESFKNAISKVSHTSNASNFHRNSQLCLEKLSSKRINELSRLMHSALSITALRKNTKHQMQVLAA